MKRLSSALLAGLLAFGHAQAQVITPSSSVTGIPAGTSSIFTSAAGAASAPALKLTGLPYNAGSGSTNWPLLLIQPQGTTSSVWSSGGTYIGVNAASGFSGRLLDLQANGSTVFNVNQSGKAGFTGIQSSGTKFSASGCSNSSTAGGASAGKFTSGTAGTCTVTVTMGNSVAASNGWSCFANDETTPADLIHETASTTTTVTLSGTTASGDVIDFGCIGY